jgi:hypothetical protein
VGKGGENKLAALRQHGCGRPAVGDVRTLSHLTVAIARRSDQAETTTVRVSLHQLWDIGVRLNNVSHRTATPLLSRLNMGKWLNLRGFPSCIP